MPLRLLPPHLINQIAAGEVIERPSAAVKELVENAIDAQASQIDIRIRDGGRSFISVSDNGVGMSEADLALAVQRHATSKMDTEDLFNIRTMGFRGEALPSIASVARLRLVSRIEKSDTAWEIIVDAGDVTPPKPAAKSNGTLVEITDLFYATPARLKFLKSTRAETMAINDIIQRLAMANPHITFALYNETKRVLYYPASLDTDMQEARLTRLKAVIGKEFSENALAVHTVRDGVQLSGWISLPTFHRSAADKQFLFINGRSVRDRLLHGAIRGGYQGWIVDGRHAVCALYIDMPFDAVDVNVHPAKTEVRFKDAAGIRALLVGGIRQAITSSGYQTSTTISHQALSSLHKENTNSDSFSPYEPTQSQLSEKQLNFTAPSSYRSRSSFSAAEINNIMGANNDVSPQSFGHSASIADNNKDMSDADDNLFPLGLARAQLHENYIISQTQNSIVIVDQHAAHERLTHQKIEAALVENGVASQSLLLPEVVNLSAQETYQILERKDELEELGLLVESFGEDAILVRATPALLGECAVEGLIKDLAAELITYDNATSLKSKLSNICATMACHSSIRSGRRLNGDEMNHLLRQMEETPGSAQCSHGRPTWIELKLHDIERLFGRR